MSLSFKSAFSGVKRLLTFDKRLESQETFESNGNAKIYHYLRENADEKSRIHLRVDPDGNGTLIVNASSVMHLNPTATFMAWMILEGKGEAETIRVMSKKWKVESRQLAEDLSAFNFQLSNLIRPDGACPIHE